MFKFGGIFWVAQSKYWFCWHQGNRFQVYLHHHFYPNSLENTTIINLESLKKKFKKIESKKQWVCLKKIIFVFLGAMFLLLSFVIYSLCDSNVWLVDH